MIEIRPFQNNDLPALVDVWIDHWSAVGPPPPVSVAMLEQAILARTFFDASHLWIAKVDGAVLAWCHFVPDKTDEQAAILGVVCFTPDGGLAVCDDLLTAVQQAIRQAGFQRVVVGPLRDDQCGYAGLAPVGHGIGVPAADSRTASLLSRSGFVNQRSVTRMALSTSPYRAPISRQALQLRRTTRIEQCLIIPDDLRRASAMAHLDIKNYRLVDHRASTDLAQISLWTSDPEAQVMSCAESILDLSVVQHRGRIEPAESYLIAAIIQTLADRRIFSVQTAVDTSEDGLIEQLKTLNFQATETGNRWEKQLV